MTLSKSKEKLIGRLRNRRMRPREGLVLVEGLHAVEEALVGGVDARFALVDGSLDGFDVGRRLLGRLEDAGVAVEHVEADTLVRVSDTETPQGVLLVCREPAAGLDDVLARDTLRVLVLDAVQDPGNLGTLVRAARAFALDGVVALDGTVDPWNPKAVRAGAGASFRIPVVRADWQEVGPALARGGVTVLVAEAEGRDVEEVAVRPPWALAVGNEGAGPRTEVVDAATWRVGVPMPGGAESLNVGVAGAILLYALARPRRS